MSTLEDLPIDEECEFCGELQIECKCKNYD